jgi:hypothetical protein
MTEREAFSKGRTQGQAGLSKAKGLEIEPGLERDRWFQGYELGHQERWSEVVTISANMPMPLAV